MSSTDPIADMICVLKNAWKVKKENIIVPFSRIKLDILTLIKSEGFVSRVETINEDGKDKLKVNLKYNENGESVISDLIRRSTPGKREYVAKKDIVKVKNGFGTAILSTNKGVLTAKQARLQNVGGEVLCYIW